MSQNDHTGWESFTNDELIDQVQYRFNIPLSIELAKRLEDLADAQEQLDEIDTKCAGLNISIAGMLRMADAMIDCPATTVALLQTLAKHDIDDVDQLTNIISKGKYDVA